MNQDPDELIEKIKNNIYEKPTHASKEFQDMISKLILSDPKLRISLSSLKKHAFFKGIDWSLAEKGRLKPPAPVLREIKQSKMPMSHYDSDNDDNSSEGSQD